MASRMKERAPSSLDPEVTTRLTEGFTRVSWDLRRLVRSELAPFGVTYAQARVLRMLALAEAPLRMSDLAARLSIVPRSATTMVDGLVSAGLVEREHDQHDRRSVLLVLSGAARALLVRMQEAERAAAETVFGRLAATDRAELVRMLDALHEGDGGERGSR